MFIVRTSCHPQSVSVVKIPEGKRNKVKKAKPVYNAAELEARMVVEFRKEEKVSISDAEIQTAEKKFFATEEELQNAIGMSFEDVLDLCESFIEGWAELAARDGHKVEKEDAAQEIRFTVWKALADFDETRGTLKNYLYACVKHAATELIRNSNALKRGAKVPESSLESFKAMQEECLRLPKDDSLNNLYKVLVRDCEQSPEDFSDIDVSCAAIKAYREIPDETTKGIVRGYFFGIVQTELAKRYGFCQSTIHGVLDRYRRRVSEILQEEKYEPNEYYPKRLKNCQKTILAHV